MLAPEVDCLCVKRLCDWQATAPGFTPPHTQKQLGHAEAPHTWLWAEET